MAVLVLALATANAAMCAGWAPTPEARMACCTESGACPMHAGKSHDPGPDHVLTQAQADSCCAASESESSGQPSPTFAAGVTIAVLGPATVLPVSVPALVLTDRWRTIVPNPTAPVPRHLLLSVFLV